MAVQPRYGSNDGAAAGAQVKFGGKMPWWGWVAIGVGGLLLAWLIGRG